jgi:hypothetical protein
LVLEIKSRISHMLSKPTTTKLHPKPKNFHFKLTSTL